MSGQNGSVLDSFFAYDARFTGGVYIAGTDVNRDGREDIITGAGAGGGPELVIFRSSDLAVLNSYFAAAPSFTGGVPIAAMQTGALKPALVIGPSTTGGQVEQLDPLRGCPVRGVRRPGG